MLTIIDRYILLKFVKDLAILFVSLAGVFIVVHAFSNFDDFIILGEKDGSILRVLVDFYGARILLLFDQLVGILSLMVTAFTVTYLQRGNEMTAIMAGGIPKIRIIRPLILATFVVSLVGIANREMWIPSVRDKLTRNAQDWLGDSAKQFVPRYDNDTDVYFSGRHAVAKDRSIDHPKFRLPQELDRFGRQLIAETAYYQPPTDDRPGGYLLQGVEKPANLLQIPSIGLDDKLVLLSPSDTPWLQPNQCFVVSNMDFERLAAKSDWQQYTSTWDLIGGLRNSSFDYGADTRVLVHSRFVKPILDMSLLFLGLPLILGREHRHYFVAAAQCLGMVGGFFLLVMTCQALGSNYLISPTLAAWLPAMISVPLAVAMSGPLRQ